MAAAKKRIAVIGAGPAGMTAAYVLAKNGFKPDIYEGSNSVGGLARTIELWGQRVDLGPHRFFSNERRINELWLEVLGQKYSMVPRMTRIFYEGKYFSYPLKPIESLRVLGIREATRCIASYGISLLRSTVTSNRGQTFESWVVAKFGRRLFEIFFKTYSEKLWGIRCSELDSDFAAQRIKKLSLFGAIWNAVVGPSRNTPKTLVDEFAYPDFGSGQLYERMADRVKHAGGSLMLDTQVARVLTHGKRATGIQIADGKTLDYDHVISTMPLTILVNGMDEVPDIVKEATSQLKFRNTVLVYLEVDNTDLFADNWLYIHSPELQCGRITNFRNWSPTLFGNSNKTILCMEYWCDFESHEWQRSDEEWIALARKELQHSGLAGEAEVQRGHVYRLPRCYPVYRIGYKEHLNVVVDFLRDFHNLTPIGRYGSFKYNNQDHSILMGMLAAENIILGTDHGTKHDLWSVNSDDEYQEQAMITATGLRNNNRLSD